MEEQTKRLAIAVSVTILDGVVAAYYGGIVWRTFSGMIWSKLLLLFLAAVWATTLLNLWVRANHVLCQVISDRGVAVSSLPEALRAKLLEGSDV